MTKVIRFSAVSVLVGFTLAASASAVARRGQGFGRGPRAHPGPGFNPERIEEVAEQLELDQATIDVIKDEIFAARKEMVDLRAEVRRAHLELRQLMRQDAPDKAAVLSQVEKVGQRETALKKAHVELMLEVRAHLTQAQRRELRQLMRERRSKRRQKRQRLRQRRRRHHRGGPAQTP